MWLVWCFREASSWDWLAIDPYFKMALKVSMLVISSRWCLACQAGGGGGALPPEWPEAWGCNIITNLKSMFIIRVYTRCTAQTGGREGGRHLRKHYDHASQSAQGKPYLQCTVMWALLQISFRSQQEIERNLGIGIIVDNPYSGPSLTSLLYTWPLITRIQ